MAGEIKRRRMWDYGLSKPLTLTTNTRTNCRQHTLCQFDFKPSATNGDIGCLRYSESLASNTLLEIIRTNNIVLFRYCLQHYPREIIKSPMWCVNIQECIVLNRKRFFLSMIQLRIHNRPCFVMVAKDLPLERVEDEFFYMTVLCSICNMNRVKWDNLHEIYPPWVVTHLCFRYPQKVKMDGFTVHTPVSVEITDRDWSQCIMTDVQGGFQYHAMMNKNKPKLLFKMFEKLLEQKKYDWLPQFYRMCRYNLPVKKSYNLLRYVDNVDIVTLVKIAGHLFTKTQLNDDHEGTSHIFHILHSIMTGQTTCRDVHCRRIEYKIALISGRYTYHFDVFCLEVQESIQHRLPNVIVNIVTSYCRF